ncbi:MAG: carbon starvation protein A [Candidatus Accumulibacter sp.]|jgi:carbon starvation protein CstA|nr:carbon starvation protein A [Accumulibacter sp.]
MISFIIGVAALVLGYLLYGKFVEKIFGIEPARSTPAVAKYDGVDYVQMGWKKAMLIQFLNIAGVGPIFGAIAGAMWGPWAFVWIVLGSIFAGATHDYLSGMISLRNNGASLSEIVGKYLGPGALYFIRFFSVLVLILVGVVFVTSPALILEKLIDPTANKSTIYFILLAVIIAYYVLATLLPIDKIIGRIYPVFGAALLIMGVGIFITLFTSGEIGNVPEFTFANLHPKSEMIFPALFITIACGAISGFHATQSPMMARCVKSEIDGRKVFYGAMILEGFVALIWAAAAMAHFGGQEGLAAAGPGPVVVNKVSLGLMGSFGGILAILGVVACPITSGDTAFRSARLTLADWFKIEQKPMRNRLLIAIPLFAIGVVLCFVDFGIIWRYFGWANQTLATFALWAGAAYLVLHNKNYWPALIPAVFMTCVVVSYICIAGIGFGLPYTVGIAVGVVVAALSFVWFFWAHVNKASATNPVA